MGLMLGTLRLYLDEFAKSIEGRTADEDEREGLKAFLNSQLNIARGLVMGVELERPIWPSTPPSS